MIVLFGNNFKSVLPFFTNLAKKREGALLLEFVINCNNLSSSLLLFAKIIISVKFSGLCTIKSSPLSFKQKLETLKSCDYVLCEDTRVSIKLLNHLNISKKLISFNKDNENIKNDYIITELLNGKHLGLISDAGTPRNIRSW